jgi:hypothetical protein
MPGPMSTWTRVGKIEAALVAIDCAGICLKTW